MEKLFDVSVLQILKDGIKKGYKPEEPQFKPKYFKASDNEMPPTLAELNKTASDFMEEK